MKRIAGGKPCDQKAWSALERMRGWVLFNHMRTRVRERARGVEKRDIESQHSAEEHSSKHQGSLNRKKGCDRNQDMRRQLKQCKAATVTTC